VLFKSAHNALYRAPLPSHNRKLSHILNTHHHADHTGGNLVLKKASGAKVYGPASESIAGMDVGLRPGDTVEFGGTKATVLDVGGHTRGHIAFYFESEAKLFVGDSLFALGCGRMFEGTPAQFWASLSRLRELPDETIVFCAHEYTESNARFAMSVEPNNVDLMVRVQQIQTLRAKGEPTVPSLLGVEKKTNPFLRYVLRWPALRDQHFPHHGRPCGSPCPVGATRAVRFGEVSG
jgi:hydroxyacylglutathione hydrolase